MTQLLSIRQHDLLVRVIEEYIQTAEPVSSKAIVSSGHFDVRSATIRNEMSDLEDMGFLMQLHTSGGRVPTAKAYRLYLDWLVAQEGVQISQANRRRIDQNLQECDMADPESVNKNLARAVGSISNALVMATMSRRPQPYTFGLSHLMGLPEFQEFHRISGLAQFIDEFELMAHRMWQGAMASQHGSEVKVYIGGENPIDAIRDETAIVARYRLPQGQEGTLTLVGPMRMDYRKNLGLMIYAAQVANRIAN